MLVGTTSAVEIVVYFAVIQEVVAPRAERVDVQHPSFVGHGHAELIFRVPLADAAE